MDFAFYDRINSAKKEETDDWWNGMNRIYNVFCYDYLYPNPKSVMAFVEIMIPTDSWVREKTH